MRALQLTCLLLTFSPAVHAEPAAGPSRVDFDDRIVKGQRRNGNSVYVFERQHVEMRSMVKKPRSFRSRILLSVFQD